MKVTIENEYMRAVINSFGSELTELTGKRDGIKYICPEANSDWEGIAPILFPNAGLIKDEPVLFGCRWPYRKHGFARDMEFAVSSVSATSLEMELVSNKETKALFPFDFRLSITFTLEENRLDIETNIENPGNTPMPYSIGFHPGFSCPLVPGESAEEYKLVFPHPADASRLILESGYVASKNDGFLDGETELAVREGMFDGGSYTLSGLNFNSVTLISSRSGASIGLSFPDYPNLVIWGPRSRPMSTICIEPWYAQPDRIEGEPDIYEKPFTLVNDPGGNRKLVFSITAGISEVIS